MAEYLPPALDWVRDQVELYESSGGKEGTTLRDTGLPCIIITHLGNKSGAIRKIPVMRVKVDNSYVLVGSYGGRPKNPVWVYNLRANPDVEIRDKTEVYEMQVREVTDDQERDISDSGGSDREGSGNRKKKTNSKKKEERDNESV